MTREVSQSEFKALDLAFRCLAASLKHAGILDENLYVMRLESQIQGDYPAADNKEIFNLVLQNYVDDIKRVKGPAE
ncbi:hypothetical protein K3F44_08720 [Pseudomonas sp. S07E 245]|uniref:hypothetical protein n=1 Tax=Pseudomonas sp. S07E 245 TaxID=2866278 RepID=UPI001C73081D|nr:hypothetical protein [Pseudomonas sp. S07E 245]QYX54358.1 hypothetical protein K3F44_08720 [Pseudomonas sp. S07E 245]